MANDFGKGKGLRPGENVLVGENNAGDCFEF